MSVARRIAVELCASGTFSGRPLGPADVEPVRACVERHQAAVERAEYQLVAEASEAAADALARARGHLLTLCCRCVAVLRVERAEGGCSGTSRGLCDPCLDLFHEEGGR